MWLLLNFCEASIKHP